jgi:ligand-binding sensor domain-containing protein
MRLALLRMLSLLAASAAFGLDPSRLISQYGHMTWSVQDGGLPGTPTSMAQTADGYLWVGTRNGLVRFDGVRFVPRSRSERRHLADADGWQDRSLSSRAADREIATDSRHPCSAVLRIAPRVGPEDDRSRSSRRSEQVSTCEASSEMDVPKSRGA